MKHDPNDRPSWDEYWMSFAEVAASRSPDLRKVGGVLVSEENKIISTGYNGLPSGVDEDTIDWEDREQVYPRIIHCETNLLLHAGSRFQNSRMYITMSPCKDCIKLVASSGVKRVVFKEKYKDFQESEKLADYFGIEFDQLDKETNNV